MILLQGHLDMVPQALATVDFDFTREPIPLTVEDGWVRSAAGTTLGSDDGIGVAAAMALLLDPELKCGPLAGVFTVSEEVGLNGALALSAEFLKGDFLLNLDSEEEGQLYIGCAGGARLEIDGKAIDLSGPVQEQNGAVYIPADALGEGRLFTKKVLSTWDGLAIPGCAARSRTSRAGTPAWTSICGAATRSPFWRGCWKRCRNLKSPRSPAARLTM